MEKDRNLETIGRPAAKANAEITGSELAAMVETTLTPRRQKEQAILNRFGPKSRRQQFRLPEGFETLIERPAPMGDAVKDRLVQQAYQRLVNRLARLEQQDDNLCRAALHAYHCVLQCLNHPSTAA